MIDFGYVLSTLLATVRTLDPFSSASALAQVLRPLATVSHDASSSFTGLTFNKTIGLGDFIQTVALVVTIALFGLQSRSASREQKAANAAALLARETANAAADLARKVQIYQTLEIESNSVFRFESDHKYILPYFKSNLAPLDLYDCTINDKDGTLVAVDEMRLVARKYYEITCNLFEVASRLRKQHIADMPHAPPGNGDPAETSLDKPPDEIETLRERFYDETARLFGDEDGDQCEMIRDWLMKARETAPTHAHPMAFA